MYRSMLVEMKGGGARAENEKEQIYIITNIYVTRTTKMKGRGTSRDQKLDYDYSRLQSASGAMNMLWHKPAIPAKRGKPANTSDFFFS